MLARAQLGNPQTAVQVSSIVTTAAAASVPLWAAAGAAGPIGAGIAVVGAVITALIANSGCGPTCVMATRIVDQLEPQLRANRDAYLSGPRTLANQQAALANFDAAWNWLQSAKACGAAELGDAGKRCISDRTRGGRWDWFSYYRDPIEQARPDAPPDSVTAAAEAIPAGIDRTLLLAVALIVAGAIL